MWRADDAGNRDGASGKGGADGRGGAGGACGAAGARAGAPLARPHERVVGRDLAGCTVVITRPRDQAAPLAAAVAERGGMAVVRPLIEVVPCPDAELRRVFQELPRYDAVIATSANAFRALERVLERTPGTAGVAPPCFAVGDATARAARRLGWAAECPPSAGTAAGLAAWLVERFRGGPPRRMLFLTGGFARDELPRALEAAGHRVDVFRCYVTRQATVDAAEFRDWLVRPDAAILLFSPSAAASLQSQCGVAWADPDAARAERGPAARAAIACVGPTTASACRALGIPVDLVAERPGADAVLQQVALLMAKRRRM